MCLRIIGLAGYAGVGKSTVADLLVREHGYQQFAFADRLKKLLVEINPIIGVGAEEFPEHIRLDDLLADRGWDDAKRRFPEVRRLLQVLGEGVKGLVNPHVWIAQVLDQLPSAGRLVISDVRFPAEAHALIHRACYHAGRAGIVRVHRCGVEAANNHVSENAPVIHDHLLDLSETTLADMPIKVRELAEQVETW